MPSRCVDVLNPLTIVRSIELSGVEGRLDHLAFDAASRKLFVAALGNNTVEVLDVNSGTHVKSLHGFREPQGIAVAADAKLIGVANGEGDGLQLLTVGEYRPTPIVRLGDDSDNVRYDASAKRLYVGFGSGALAAVNAGDGSQKAEVRTLPGPVTERSETLSISKRRAMVSSTQSRER